MRTGPCRGGAPDMPGGVALVSVLLVMVIASVLAASLIREQRMSTRATHGFLQRGQALQYALGGEEVARQILREDLEQAPESDHLLETWATPTLDFDFEEGEVDVSITDLQGKINVNGLSPENPGVEVARQRLTNLAGAVGADPSLVDQLQDWIDGDDGARPLGAEDFEYLGLEPPHRTADSLMADVSEVRFMPGLSLETYRRLGPALAALPEPKTHVNINTAGPLVIQSLVSGLGDDAAASLVERRDLGEGFESVTAFLQSPELAGLRVDEAGLGVQSAFFRIRVVARYQDRYSYLTSIVHRSPADGSLRVIQRNFSRNLVPPTSEGDPPGG